MLPFVRLPMLLFISRTFRWHTETYDEFTETFYGLILAVDKYCWQCYKLKYSPHTDGIYDTSYDDKATHHGDT